MSQQFFDLKFEQAENGVIRLQQLDYAGGSATIVLHPAQIKHIAEVFGLVKVCKTDPALQAENATLRRRLRVIADRLCGFAGQEVYRFDVVNHCTSGVEMLAVLDSICDLAVEFCNDAEIQKNDEQDKAAPPVMPADASPRPAASPTTPEFSLQPSM